MYSSLSDSYKAINKVYPCKAISFTFGIYCFKIVPKLILKNLRRENELLKHQLKKYVGAVQALRTNMQSRSPDTAEGKTINFKYLKLNFTGGRYHNTIYCRF